MSAFTLLNRPQALPGHCFKCRSSDREFFIDLMISEEFYGAVIICSECLLEMANLAGYISPDQAASMAEKYAAMGIENIELRGKLEGVEEVVATIHRVFPQHNSNGNTANDISGQTSLPVGEDTTETLSAGSGQTPQIPVDGERELAGRTPISTEQSNEQGLANVPDSGIQPFKLGLV